MGDLVVFRTAKDLELDEDCQKLWNFMVDEFTDGSGKNIEIEVAVKLLAMVDAMGQALKGCLPKDQWRVVLKKANDLRERQNKRVGI